MFEITIGIIGVILTAGFSIYSLRKMKKTTPKIELSFSKNECFSLIDESYNELGLDIKYKGNKITNSVILLKAIIKNTGSLDIDRNLVFSPLKIISLPQYKWLEAKIVSTPIDANIELKISTPNELTLIWDLLKENEWIEIEMVIEETEKPQNEVPSTVNFYDNIKFEYRITNLKNIKKDSYSVSFQKINNRFFKIWFSLGLIYLIMGVTLPTLPFLLNRQNLVYVVRFDNSTSKLELTPKKDSLLKIKNLENLEENEINIKDFNVNYEILSIETQKENPFSWSLSIIGILTFIASIFLFKRSYNHWKKIKNEKRHTTKAHM